MLCFTKNLNITKELFEINIKEEKLYVAGIINISKGVVRLKSLLSES